MGMSLLSPLLLLAVTGAVHADKSRWSDNAQDNFDKVHKTASMTIGVILAIVIASLTTPCIIACCIWGIIAYCIKGRRAGVVHQPPQLQPQTGGQVTMQVTAGYNPGYNGFPAQQPQTVPGAQYPPPYPGAPQPCLA